MIRFSPMRRDILALSLSFSNFSNIVLLLLLLHRQRVKNVPLNSATVFECNACTRNEVFVTKINLFELSIEIHHGYYYYWYRSYALRELCSAGWNHVQLVILSRYTIEPFVWWCLLFSSLSLSLFFFLSHSLQPDFNRKQFGENQPLHWAQCSNNKTRTERKNFSIMLDS